MARNPAIHVKYARPPSGIVMVREEESGSCNNAKAAFTVTDFLHGGGQAQLQWVVAVRLESPQCGVD